MATKLPPGVTQAMIDASLAANPNASRGGYMGAPQTYHDPVYTGPTMGYSPGTPGTPEYNPDYAAMILGDPLYSQQRTDLSAQGVADAAQRKAKTGRALINFGEVPNLTDAIRGFGLDPNSALYRMLFSDVDPATQRGAQDLTGAGLSTTAGLGREHEFNVNDLLDRLAARGIVRSGATGVGLGQEDQRYSGAQFGARSGLLDYLSGLQAAFAQSEAGRVGQLGQGAQDATARQIGLHPYRAAVPGTPGTVTTSGGSLKNNSTAANSAFANQAVPGGGGGMPPSVTLQPFAPHDMPLPSVQGHAPAWSPHDLPFSGTPGFGAPYKPPAPAPSPPGAPLSAYGTPQERQAAANPVPDAVPSGLSRPDTQALLRRLNMDL